MPEAVWEYAIGGYKVLKKWLSYREKQVLGRDITKDEAREFTHIVRRIAALLLLEPELDKNYAAIKANCHPWSAPSASTKDFEHSSPKRSCHSNEARWVSDKASSGFSGSSMMMKSAPRPVSTPPTDVAKLGCKQRIRSAVNDRIGIEPNP